MARFTLRRLLLVAAILPPLIAGVWYWFDLGKVHAGTEDNAVRKKLLAYTPPGTSPDEVIDFVVNKLHRSGEGNAYSKYLWAYEASTGRIDNHLTPTALEYGDGRAVEVIVSTRPVGFFCAHVVEATWHFDEQDRLTDITTTSYGIGP